MRKLLITTMLIALVMGCSREYGSRELDQGTAVHFTAGSLDVTTSQPSTKTNLAAGTHVRIVVFKSGTYTGIPVAEGVYKTESDGSLKSLGSVMRISKGGNYDFYAYCVEGESTDLGYANNGNPAVGGVTHGKDILAGGVMNINIASSASPTKIDVDFGDLSHIGSKVSFMAAPTDNLISAGVTTFAISDVTWKRISESASLTLNPAHNPSKLTVSGNDGSFTIATLSSAAAPKFETSGSGIILPYPVVAPATKNNISMGMMLSLNGKQAPISATSLDVPEFMPGVNYTFILQVEPTKINLSLYFDPSDPDKKPTPEDWKDLDWNSSIGAGGVLLKLGSWDVISWGSGIGSGGVGLILGGWKPCKWNSSIGSGGVGLTLSEWLKKSWSSTMGEVNEYPD